MKHLKILRCLSPSCSLAGLTIIVLFGPLVPLATAKLARLTPPNPYLKSLRDDSRISTDSEGSRDPVSTIYSATRRVTRTSAGAMDAVADYVSANQFPEGDMPRQLAATPDGSTVVIMNRDTDSMTFFDINSRNITHTVMVEDFPVDVAVTPDGKFAVAPNVFSNSVSIVDIANHAVAAHVPVTGDQP